MKVYKNIQQVKKDIVNHTLSYSGDIKLDFNLDIEANIKCMNLYGKNIDAWDIDAKDINAKNIEAKDINAENINAWGINADYISYHAVCFAYQDITCKSIKGRRNNSKHFSLDGEIIILD